MLGWTGRGSVPPVGHPFSSRGVCAKHKLSYFGWEKPNAPEVAEAVWCFLVASWRDGLSSSCPHPQRCRRLRWRLGGNREKVPDCRVQVKPKKCKYPKGQYGEGEFSNNQLGMCGHG